MYGCFKSAQVTEDTRIWYLAGTSTKGSLKDNNWADAGLDEALKETFQLTATGNATNEFEFSSYFGKIVETPYLIFDPVVQKKNFRETDKLITNLVEKGYSFERAEAARGRYIVQNVPKTTMVE